MKRLIPIILCSAISACADFSDNMGEKTYPTLDKLAEKIMLGYEEDGTETPEIICSLDYDGKNRLKTVMEHEDSGNTYVTNFMYESNKVICAQEYMSDGSIKSYTTIYEFENGKLQRVTDDEGFTGVFRYNAGVAKPVRYETNEGTNYKFSWDNLGNLMTRYEEVAGFGNYSVGYSYSNVQDKCNVDLRAMIDFEMDGLPLLFDKGVFKCISSSNLPNSIDNIMYKYEYDSDGYVTKITILSGDEEHPFLRISYRSANQQ